ncbi:MAG: hypothetical protein CM1200mP13_03960 [Candidatus Pelagibacterales bacterium]|nr:MAG: hypothetical protein CM1200mP13_03960 [Pelagibacterales bacterium]
MVKEHLFGAMENKKQVFGRTEVTRIMSKENYINKIKDLPESLDNFLVLYLLL